MSKKLPITQKAIGHTAVRMVVQLIGLEGQHVRSREEVEATIRSRARRLGLSEAAADAFTETLMLEYDAQIQASTLRPRKPERASA